MQRDVSDVSGYIFSLLCNCFLILLATLLTVKWNDLLATQQQLHKKNKKFPLYNGPDLNRGQPVKKKFLERHCLVLPSCRVLQFAIKCLLIVRKLGWAQS